MKKTLVILCVSLCVMFSCKPKEDDSAITPQTNKINGHEYVDLGLPSGLKWATCNVGASSPERRGNYYAWGEIINKDYYNYDNCYTYNNEDIPDISGKVKYDVARKEWGGTWRIPKRNEMRELIDECAWELVYENDIYAYKVTGRNSKYILLPVTGRYEKYTIENYGNSGYYWTSTPDKINDYSTNAYCLFFDDEYEIELEKRVRYYGQAVRPVSE